MPERTSDELPALLEHLAWRAAAEGEEPWLFWRWGWNWKWRSWRQTADQVARGAGRLARLAAPRIAFENRLDPDALAVGLAIRLAGKTAAAVAGEPPAGTPAAILADADDDGGGTAGASGLILMPRCRSRLERWRPAPLEPRRDLGGLAEGLEGEALDAGILEDGSRRFAELLAAASASASRRAILAASPALDVFRIHALLDWSVRTGAAWVLEPDPDAFESAVRWSRPTLLVAPGDELEDLAATLSGTSHRRHLRLRAAVATDGLPGGEGTWRELGVELARWPH